MMMPRYLQLFIAFIGVLLVVNVLILDIFLVQQRGELLAFQTRLNNLNDNFRVISTRLFGNFPGDVPAATGSGATDTTGSLAAKSLLNQLGALDACPQTCVSLINASTISGTIAQTPTSIIRTPTSQLISSAGSTNFALTKGEYFIPLGSGTVNQSNTWVTMDSAQATFDFANFPGLKTAYFEVFYHNPRTNGEANVRLIDTTSGIPFSSTQDSTTSTTTVYESFPIVLNPGERTYQVQMYNTLDQAVLDQARIRIVSQ